MQGKGITSFRVKLVKKSSRSKKVSFITIPNFIYRLLPHGKKVLIKVGMFKKWVECKSNSSRWSVEFPSGILREYNGLLNVTTNLSLVDGALHFEPVVGMFISNGQIRKLKRQEPIFRHVEFTRAKKRTHTILYFFSIHNVDFTRQKVHGICYDDQKKKWRQLTFPFPDILYDRGGGVLRKQILKSEHIRKQFSELEGMRSLNPQYFFDKWEVHTKLCEQKQMKPHLPQAELYNGLDTLRNMFKKHTSLYLKDCLGNNGRGVMRLVHLSEEDYVCSYVRKGSLVERTLVGLNNFEPIVHEFFAEKKIIVQEGIDVMTLEDRNLDFRATLQRNGLGELEITSYPVRVGSIRSPVTSSQTGSHIYVWEDFFKNQLNYSAEQIQSLKRTMEPFLFTCYAAIETSYGTFGELGIDFALDKKGHFWFIECNAKPGFNCMYKSYNQATIARTFSNPLAYARYINSK